jgi:hypothetical protein
MQDLIELYDLLPKKLPDEHALDVFLTNVYKIKPWDLATLSAYRDIVYRYQFMVLPKGENGPRMIKGIRPPEWTAERQTEYLRERERERYAERERLAQKRLEESVLEPKRREFVSQLTEALEDPQVLARVETAIAQQRAGE